MEDLLQPSPSRDPVDHAGTSAATIPFDFIVEIFSLLPAKSIIRFQSVSKLWFSTIRSKVFVDKFLTRSKTRPRLLLTVKSSASKKLFFFSAPEHNNNGGDDKSTTVIARHDIVLHDVYYIRSRPVNGFICFKIVSDYCNSIAVCNPTTRQIVKLPEVRTDGRHRYAHLGYDPVEDQYKVLCVTMMFNRREYFVCTVSSSQKQEWRKIENTTGVNYPIVYQGICVDGAIYGVGLSMIVKFDVRSEKVELIKVPKELNMSRISNSTLINYNGKLCGIYYAYKTYMRLWVLENAEKQEWSSMTCDFPSEWEGDRGLTKRVHTGADLIILYDRWLELSKPYCVYYYYLNKESTRKVEIHGVENGLGDSDFRSICGNLRCRMFSCPGYVDNIRFL